MKTKAGLIGSWALLGAWLVTLGSPVAGHVRLTFPPARDLELDFLDTARTKGPCGMPKGEPKAALVSGTSFNVTWHLAYPHRGTFG